MPTWNILHRYLFLDKKLDESRVRILQGQYQIIQSYFQDKKWNRDNILSFFEYLLRDRKVKRSTCNSYLKLLKHIDAYKRTKILDGYSYFKEDPVIRTPLTTEEIISLAEVDCESNQERRARNRAIIYTLALTGMRVGELCNLTLDIYASYNNSQ